MFSLSSGITLRIFLKHRSCIIARGLQNNREVIVMTTFADVMWNQLEDDMELGLDGDMVVSPSRGTQYRPPNTVFLIVGILKWQGFESLS